jgi:SAM-dependent methyltransferase
MTSSVHTRKESFVPPPNRPPEAGVVGKCRFAARRIMDLMVASVLRHLEPWLAGQNGSLLDVGCGAQPYRHMVPKVCHYQGLDWKEADIHFNYSTEDTRYYSGASFPFPDAAFDALFHTEVLEHVFDFRFFLKECKRVLKPGSSMFFTVPFQARYHYIPHDYWRFTPSSLTKLLDESGFKDVVIIPRGTDVTVASYKVISVIYRWILGGPFGKLMGAAASPIWVIALLTGHISICWNLGSLDDCLGYVVTARA